VAFPCGLRPCGMGWNGSSIYLPFLWTIPKWLVSGMVLTTFTEKIISPRTIEISPTGGHRGNQHGIPLGPKWENLVTKRARVPIVIQQRMMISVWEIWWFLSKHMVLCSNVESHSHWMGDWSSELSEIFHHHDLRITPCWSRGFRLGFPDDFLLKQYMVGDRSRLEFSSILGITWGYPVGQWVS
jgi:hypothetical protein